MLFYFYRDFHVNPQSYLVDEKFLDPQKEEAQLSLLCIQYLTFDCFDTNHSDSTLLKFLEEGYYAFLNYASIHWIHHLESALSSLASDDLTNSSSFGMAINAFIEMWGPVQKEHGEMYLKLAKINTAIGKAECYEDLLLLLCEAKSGRVVEEELEGLGFLRTIIAKVATALKDLSTSPNSESLKQFYGNNWYKCTRHACYYFHEGFNNESNLSTHTNRHEKPFCCTEMGCTRSFIGYSTERELKRHMSQYHPDPEALSWKFAHVKKAPTVFQCELCTKQYPRASILKTHTLREHGSERPYTCKTCGKGFVRKYECGRHESAHKTASAESSQPLSAENSDNTQS
jgi:hypothetical protein